VSDRFPGTGSGNQFDLDRCPAGEFGNSDSRAGVMAFDTENVSQYRGCGINDHRLLVETGSGANVSDQLQNTLDVVECAQCVLQNGQGIEYARSGAGLTLCQTDRLTEAACVN